MQKNTHKPSFKNDENKDSKNELGKTTLNNKKQIDSEELTEENIFPVVSYSDYYSKIKIIDSEPVIDEDMIAYIIQDIIKKISVNYGKIEVGYFQPKKNQLQLKFIWKSNNQTIYKNYYFNLYDESIKKISQQ